ncbi:hypothetical protein FISHEDRAFT_58429 [Fistulina hepatica ATCC 64428]|nr:hypothetical protein FISHEDRAFT_58429 [Fistulina hepatica ATCC 64428]
MSAKELYTPSPSPKKESIRRFAAAARSSGNVMVTVPSFSRRPNSSHRRFNANFSMESSLSKKTSLLFAKTAQAIHAIVPSSSAGCGSVEARCAISRPISPSNLTDTTSSTSVAFRRSVSPSSDLSDAPSLSGNPLLDKPDNFLPCNLHASSPLADVPGILVDSSCNSLDIPVLLLTLSRYVDDEERRATHLLRSHGLDLCDCSPPLKEQDSKGASQLIENAENYLGSPVNRGAIHRSSLIEELINIRGLSKSANTSGGDNNLDGNSSYCSSGSEYSFPDEPLPVSLTCGSQVPASDFGGQVLASGTSGNQVLSSAASRKHPFSSVNSTPVEYPNLMIFEKPLASPVSVDLLPTIDEDDSRGNDLLCTSNATSELPSASKDRLTPTNNIDASINNDNELSTSTSGGCPTPSAEKPTVRKHPFLTTPLRMKHFPRLSPSILRRLLRSPSIRLSSPDSSFGRDSSFASSQEAHSVLDICGASPISPDSVQENSPIPPGPPSFPEAGTSAEKCQACAELYEREEHSTFPTALESQDTTSRAKIPRIVDEGGPYKHAPVGSQSCHEVAEKDTQDSSERAAKAYLTPPPSDQLPSLPCFPSQLHGPSGIGVDSQQLKDVEGASDLDTCPSSRAPLLSHTSSLFSASPQALNPALFSSVSASSMTPLFRRPVNPLSPASSVCSFSSTIALRKPRVVIDEHRAPRPPRRSPTLPVGNTLPSSILRRDKRLGLGVAAVRNPIPRLRSIAESGRLDVDATHKYIRSVSPSAVLNYKMVIDEMQCARAKLNSTNTAAIKPNLAHIKVHPAADAQLSSRASLPQTLTAIPPGLGIIIPATQTPENNRPPGNKGESKTAPLSDRGTSKLVPEHHFDVEFVRLLGEKAIVDDRLAEELRHLADRFQRMATARRTLATSVRQSTSNAGI